MKIQRVSINGEILDVNFATVEALDSSLTFSIGAIETFRVSGGKVFLLDEHINRLTKTLDVLSIFNFEEVNARKHLRKLIAEYSDDEDLFIRLFVTAGAADLTFFNQRYSNPSIIIYSVPIPGFKPEARPAKILTSVVRQKPEYFEQVGFRMKTPDYLTASLAQKELNNWKEKNDFSKNAKIEGIMLNEDSFVAEALTSNVFWIKNAKIITSPLSLGVLPGTLRAYIIKNYKVTERKAKQEELIAADEIFLTNGVNYLLPLSQINEVKKPGLKGKVFQRLLNNFR